VTRHSPSSSLAPLMLLLPPLFSYRLGLDAHDGALAIEPGSSPTLTRRLPPVLLVVLGTQVLALGLVGKIITFRLGQAHH
jgi:hypothetical protein